MKNILFPLVVYIIANIFATAQNGVVFNVNNYETYITNTNYLFGKTSMLGPEYFKFPKNNLFSIEPMTILTMSAKSNPNNQIHSFPINYFCGFYCYPFKSGPLKTNGSLIRDSSINYNKVWNITDTDINEFISAYYAGGNTWANYSIPSDFLTWPAHGPNGYDPNLSEFHDMNGDGIYNPYDGDFPKIKGTQYLRWIYNDVVIPEMLEMMGVEIRASLFGCSSPNPDDAINRTIFIEYEIVNRTNKTYTDVGVGLMINFMIGCFENDNFRSNAKANAVQFYNSNQHFNLCTEENYFVQNPMVWGIGLIDVNNSPNEYLSSSLLNLRVSTVGDVVEFGNLGHLYNAHQAKHFIYGKPVRFGGTGFEDTTAALAKYMFPGDSDPDFIGTNGIPYPYSWTYENYNNTGVELMPVVDYNFNNVLFPSLAPNEKIKVAYAIVGTQSTSLNTEQLLALNAKEIIEMRNQYQNNAFQCQASVLNIEEPKSEDHRIYPNPTSHQFSIDFDKPIESIKLYTLTGKLIKTCNNCKSMNIEDLNTGIYIVNWEVEGKHYHDKIIKK